MASMQARIERGNIETEREAAIHVGHAFSISTFSKESRLMGCLLEIGRLRHSYGPCQENFIMMKHSRFAHKNMLC